MGRGSGHRRPWPSAARHPPHPLTLLALELHGVHGGADAVLAADLVNLADAAGVEEHALRQRGLAAVNVRRDANVAQPLYRRRCGGRADGRATVSGGGGGGGGGSKNGRG